MSIVKRAMRWYQGHLIATKINNGLIANFLSAVKSQLKTPENYRLTKKHTVEAALTFKENWWSMANITRWSRNRKCFRR